MDEIAAGNVEWVKSGASIKDGGEPARRRRRKKTGRQGAPSGAPPKFIAPQLATLVDAPPDGDDWLHEIKFDGYRVVAAVGGGKAVIYTRTGLDWTDKFRPLVRPLADLPLSRR